MMDSGKEFSIRVDGFKITGQTYYPELMQEQHPALIICHGIPAAEPTPGDRGYPLLAEKFAGEGFITCIFNFRGCGDSEGNLDLLDWTRDLDGIISYVAGLEGVDRARLSLMGFSGGAAASAYVAAHNERVSALILCACPARFSIGGLGQSPQEFLEQCRRVGTVRDSDFPPSLDEWAGHFRQVSPLDCIDRISPRPLLIIHGDEDETIPPDHAGQLYAGAKEPRELVMIEGGEHRLRTNEKAMALALDWLKRVNKNRGRFET
ncbi:MAG: alpha/beta fold hydrolase [Dehalococcoidia bacterium]